MWRPYYVTAGAEHFAFALEGRGPASSQADALVRAARELTALAANLPPLSPSPHGRLRLLQEVEQHRNGRRAALPAPARRGMRGGVLAAATVAGGGLLVAGAVSGSSVAEIFSEAVSTLPLFSDGAAPEPLPTAVVVVREVQGVIAESDDRHDDLRILTSSSPVPVELSPTTGLRADDGSPVTREDLVPGVEIRIHGAQPGSGAIRATEIEVIRRPKLTATPTALAEEARVESASGVIQRGGTPLARPAIDPATARESKPTPRPTPAAVETPKPPAPAVVVAVVPTTATLEPATPARTATPKSTPTLDATVVVPAATATPAPAATATPAAGDVAPATTDASIGTPSRSRMKNPSDPF